MTTLTLRIPDSYHKSIKDISKSENVSINQWITSAVAEKLSALRTADYLEMRAERASREKFERALEALPAAEPLKADKIPD
jgi:hypothetical protein